jgi:hypothetical protein
MPVVPAACALAGVLCADVAARLSPRRAAGITAPFVLALAIDPLLRSVALDRLFARRSTFQEALAVIEAQADRPRVCAPKAIALGSDPDVPIRPLDPLDWPAERDVLILLARHPHPVVGDEWANLKNAIEISGRAETLLDVRAFADFPGTGARFEENDWFLYPLAGFEGVERGGPDLVLYRIHRLGVVATAPASCAAPSVTFDRAGDRRRFLIAPPVRGGCPHVACYAKLQGGSVAREEDWSVPILCRVEGGEIVIPPGLSVWPGRYLVAFALATLEGLGAWSSVLTIELP